MPYNIQAHLVLPKIKAENRKQAFKILTSAIAAQVNCEDDMLLELMMNKEKMASSGIGEGVAIPHMKLNGIPARFIALATLDTPVDFQAIDNKPVDIICTLLSPESDGPIHLRGLSRISRILKNEALKQKLRETDDVDMISALFANPEGLLLAA